MNMSEDGNDDDDMYDGAESISRLTVKTKGVRSAAGGKGSPDKDTAPAAPPKDEAVLFAEEKEAIEYIVKQISPYSRRGIASARMNGEFSL